MNKVGAILSDFDGTLCPTTDLHYKQAIAEYIPFQLENVLCEVSCNIPICIVTSKDFDFVYPRTKKFAKILSCILGLETFVLNDKNQFYQTKNISSENKKLYIEDSIVDSRISTFDTNMISINAYVLNEIATFVEKNYQNTHIKKKFLKDYKKLLCGITIDWRNDSNWMDNRKKYNSIVKESLSIVLENIIQKAKLNISQEKLAYCANNLFIQEYAYHPFLDIYVTKLNKGDAYDFAVSKLSKISEISGKIVYLGDSENDNPAFRKSDISIGVNSDERLNTELESKYTIKFENLSFFLKKLLKNNFVFLESFLNF